MNKRGIRYVIVVVKDIQMYAQSWIPTDSVSSETHPARQLGGAQARGEEYTTRHSKGYINVGENCESEESASDNTG
jgi:hypothetical protein